MRAELFHYRGDRVPALAILVKLTGSGTHTGFLYRYQGRLIVLDLLWHEQFRVSYANEQEYDFVIPNLEPEETVAIANACQLIVLRTFQHGMQRIRYGFARPVAPQVNSSGEILFGDGAGLTCATFVLSVFESERVPFVDLSDWGPRPEDDLRHQNLLRMMRESPTAIDPAHIATMEAELPCIRVRPEEVAGIAISKDRPTCFIKAERIGEWILEKLNRRDSLETPSP